jgi:hypothetical protein
MGNAVRQDAHSVATFAASMSQRVTERDIENEMRFDSMSPKISSAFPNANNSTGLTANIQALMAQDSSSGHPNDDALLAGLANGHNEAMARITQMQGFMMAMQDRLAALEANTTTNTATLGEVNRMLQVITMQLDSRSAPATIPTPLAPALAPFTPALAPFPVAPAATVPIAVAAGLPLVAPSMPSMADFAAVMQSSFAAAMRNTTKRSHDDDDDESGSRNVRPRTDVGTALPMIPPPVSKSVRPPPVNAANAGLVTVPAAGGRSTFGAAHAPASTTGPPRRVHDPPREAIFGPANWPSNFFAGSRNIIWEGLEPARPLLRFYYARPGPDENHIIIGFETIEATTWFIDAWMSHRPAKWSTIDVVPNA